MSYLRTSDLARAVGCHPNTVRRYVDRGILPPIERTLSGYRLFTQRHLDCLRLARLVYAPPPAGLALLRSAVHVLQPVVAGDLASALKHAHDHLALVRAERTHAELAAELLERWAFAARFDTADDGASPPSLRIGQLARLLSVTVDVVRSWDRNGLIDVPRDPSNGYRRYGPREISRMRVIRVLSRAGYSMSAILRMLLQLDRGETSGLRRALDTPRPDEDAHLASDRWLSTLAEQERRAHAIIALLEELCQHQTAAASTR